MSQLDRVLNAIRSAAPNALSVDQIVGRLGIPRPSARRCLNQLCKAGCLEKADGRYALSLPLNAIVTGYRVGSDLYVGRRTSCTRCGRTGLHTCCPHCDNSADGIEELGEVFGWRRGHNRHGTFFRLQPQCRECRRKAAQRSRARGE